MKKLLAILTILLLASTAFGAGTIVITDDTSYPGISLNDETRVISYQVDFDATTADIPNTVLRDINNEDGTTANRNAKNLAGWFLWKIETFYGGTGPTDNSDLYIWSTEDRSDILGNQGLNMIDNATDNVIYPANCSQMLTGLEIFDIDGQSVSDASCTLKFYLHR